MIVGMNLNSFWIFVKFDFKPDTCAKKLKLSLSLP